MEYMLLAVPILVLLLSCSNVNQASRERYNNENKMKHGIVPIEVKSDNNSESDKSIPQKLDQASVQRGRAIYNKHCLSCHGDKGLGDGPEAGKQAHPPANLKKLAKEVSNFKFFMSISQWQGDMPGWKDTFNELDREDLASYIKSFRFN